MGTDCSMWKPGSVADQVWSLTQLYSVDFLQSRIGVKNCRFQQSRFVSAVFDGVLGYPRLARHTGRCPCISAVMEAKQMASQGPLNGGWVNSKGLSWVIDGDEGVAGRNGRE